MVRVEVGRERERCVCFCVLCEVIMKEDVVGYIYRSSTKTIGDPHRRWWIIQCNKLIKFFSTSFVGYVSLLLPCGICFISSSPSSIDFVPSNSRNWSWSNRSSMAITKYEEWKEYHVLQSVKYITSIRKGRGELPFPLPHPMQSKLLTLWKVKGLQYLI